LKKYVELLVLLFTEHINSGSLQGKKVDNAQIEQEITIPIIPYSIINFNGDIFFKSMKHFIFELT
jgi:hypothetical protein